MGIEGANGVEVLLHIGVDTVDMNGDGFTPAVKEGDNVEKGQLLLSMDLEKIQAAGHPSTVIMIVTNSDDFASVEQTMTGSVSPGTDLMKVGK